jgi:hypothetical protein
MNVPKSEKSKAPISKKKSKLWSYVVGYFNMLYMLGGKFVYVMRWAAYNYGFHTIAAIGTILYFILFRII